MGKIVNLKHSLSVSEVVSMVKKHLQLEHGESSVIFGHTVCLVIVQLSTPEEERPIKSIAVCAGSGTSSSFQAGNSSFAQPIWSVV